ncbi:MAG: diguanylate cyclase [Phycisphaerae bacterium]|nr:diguanylate cyclase [Phycisphaerae bacterium]
MEHTEHTPHIVVMSPHGGDGDGAEHLTAARWHVTGVSDEIEAFSTLRSGQADLVLLHLPVQETMDMDLPAVLRSVADDAYLPVMILAGDADEDETCAYLDSGADEVVSADAAPAELIARARALLRIKDLHDQLAASRASLGQALQRERKLMTQLRRDNAELRDLATTDPLTRVQNVRSFHDLLAHEFHVAKRYGKPLSVLMLDLDHFKVINDTHGHPSGDYVLKELAVILRQSVRESDGVARTGGEEFAMILPRASRDQARCFAERIRQEVDRRTFSVHGHDIHVTASVGTATFPEDAEITDPEMLFYCADQALLEAKESGRDRVTAFGDLAPEVRRRLRSGYLAVGGPAAAAASKAAS